MVTDGSVKVARVCRLPWNSQLWFVHVERSETSLICCPEQALNNLRSFAPLRMTSTSTDKIRNPMILRRLMRHVAKWGKIQLQ
jgi:hypothetical protein